jgi:hypothetical protein
MGFHPGRGHGRQGGMGMNLRRKRCWSQDMYYPGDNEPQQLLREAQFHEASLAQIKKRLSELEKQETKKEG